MQLGLKKPFVPIIRLLVLTPHEPSDLKFIDESIKRMNFDNSGSVQRQLTVPQISEINIIYPPSEMREKYANITSDSVRNIELIKDQNQQLSTLRDWLLPMLMNGQVTVK
jgi:type I restriction enzyme S subunit